MDEGVFFFFLGGPDLTFLAAFHLNRSMAPSKLSGVQWPLFGATFPHSAGRNLHAQGREAEDSQAGLKIQTPHLGFCDPERPGF